MVDDAALTHEYWYKSKLIPVEYNEYRISECIKKRYIIIPSKEKMRIKEIIETMGVCFDRLEKYNAFQIMNEWLPRQSETFQEQVKKKSALYGHIQVEFAFLFSVPQIYLSFSFP